MPETAEWVNLYNPSQQAWHRVPNHPAVVQDFQDRGWETPEESAERAAGEAEQLRGRALVQALEEAGLPNTGTADEKRKALAEHAAQQNQAAQADTTTENTESEGSE
jgi:hypothetical protein